RAAHEHAVVTGADDVEAIDVPVVSRQDETSIAGGFGHVREVKQGTLGVGRIGAELNEGAVTARCIEGVGAVEDVSTAAQVDRGSRSGSLEGAGEGRRIDYGAGGGRGPAGSRGQRVWIDHGAGAPGPRGCPAGAGAHTTAAGARATAGGRCAACRGRAVLPPSERAPCSRDGRSAGAAGALAAGRRRRRPERDAAASGLRDGGP